MTNKHERNLDEQLNFGGNNIQKKPILIGNKIAILVKLHTGLGPVSQSQQS